MQITAAPSPFKTFGLQTPTAEICQKATSDRYQLNQMKHHRKNDINAEFLNPVNRNSFSTRKLPDALAF